MGTQSRTLEGIKIRDISISPQATAILMHKIDLDFVIIVVIIAHVVK